MAQHSVVGPVTTLAGPGGSQSVVQISGFAAGDQAKKFPTTLTIVLEEQDNEILYPGLS